MKLRKWVSIRGYKDKSVVERDLAAAKVLPREGEWSPGITTHGWRGWFDASDARWVVLRDQSAKSGIPALIIESIQYTSEELLSAELLQLIIPTISKGDSGPEYGNQYDLTGSCPYCWSGARLIPPFRMAPKDLPKKRQVAVTFRDEYLVTGELAEELCAVPGSEAWLVPVVDRSNDRALPWFAVNPAAVLPRSHPSSRGLVRELSKHPLWTVCPQCERDRWGTRNDEAVVLRYARSELQRVCERWLDDSTGLPDLAGSWELGGPGTRPDIPNARSVAQPLIKVVSQRVARIFTKHAAKWIQLAPVQLI